VNGGSGIAVSTFGRPLNVFSRRRAVGFPEKTDRDMLERELRAPANGFGSLESGLYLNLDENYGLRSLAVKTS